MVVKLAENWLGSPGTEPGTCDDRVLTEMEGTSYDRDELPTRVLPAHAALIRSAARLNGEPHKGWYFAVMVRAAYSRLEGST